MVPKVFKPLKLYFTLIFIIGALRVNPLSDKQKLQQTTFKFFLLLYFEENKA